MANPADAGTWISRGVFVFIAFVIMVVQLVPQSMEPNVVTLGWLGSPDDPWQFTMVRPDVCLAVTLVWVARRPRYAPVWIIAAIFLMGDMVFQRPPGLWAALVVILTEGLRKRSREFRTASFMTEWISVTMGIIMITLANRFILAVLMTPLAPLGMILLQMFLTIAIYPLVVVIAHYLFGVGRIAPSETGSRGQRI